MNPGTTKRRKGTKWQRRRKRYLAANPFCEVCIAADRITPAVQIHHIKPLHDGGEAMNPDNFQAICADCHSTVHHIPRNPKNAKIVPLYMWRSRCLNNSYEWKKVSSQYDRNTCNG